METEPVEVTEWWSLYRGDTFVLRAPSKDEAEESFHILRAVLPEKYMGTHIEWQGCLFGGARGEIVNNSVPKRVHRQYDAWIAA